MTNRITRREAIRQAAAIGGGLALGPRGNAAMPAASESQRRPNVIFILSDDQGPWAAGCCGNSEIRTPNIDRLAETGTRFSKFFVSTPVCVVDCSVEFSDRRQQTCPQLKI